MRFSPAFLSACAPSTPTGTFSIRFSLSRRSLRRQTSKRSAPKSRLLVVVQTLFYFANNREEKRERTLLSRVNETRDKERERKRESKKCALDETFQTKSLLCLRKRMKRGSLWSVVLFGGPSGQSKKRKNSFVLFFREKNGKNIFRTRQTRLRITRYHSSCLSSAERIRAVFITSTATTTHFLLE